MTEIKKLESGLEVRTYRFGEANGINYNDETNEAAREFLDSLKDVTRRTPLEVGDHVWIKSTLGGVGRYCRVTVHEAVVVRDTKTTVCVNYSNGLKQLFYKSGYESCPSKYSREYLCIKK